MKKHWTEEEWKHLDTNIILDLARRMKKESKVTIKTITKIKNYEIVKHLDLDFLKYDLKTLSIYKDTIIKYDKKSLILTYSNKQTVIYTFNF